MTRIQPMGDQAALARFAAEEDALRFAEAVRRLAPDWLVDVVGAYAAVAVFFRPDQARFDQVAGWLRDLDWGSGGLAETGVLHRIPCCYDFPLDQERVAERTGLGVDDVIRLHAETEFRVYAIGFCPGFPYLGYLPAELSGVPRLDTPRVKVPAGSVGLTGRQTGIYTEERPAGWNLLGCTPLTLVSLADGYFPLRVGDRVRFERIDERAYNNLAGERLPMPVDRPIEIYSHSR